jgi:hypothetical protein
LGDQLADKRKAAVSLPLDERPNKGIEFGLQRNSHTFSLVNSLIGQKSGLDGGFANPELLAFLDGELGIEDVVPQLCLSQDAFVSTNESRQR